MHQKTLLALALLGVLTASGGAKAGEALPPAFCQALVKHVPDAGVAYEEGRDVYGRPVVPADLGGGNSPVLPSKIKIPVTLQLQKVLGLDTQNYPFNSLGQTDINLGELAVEGNKVTYNGQPLTETEQDNLAVLCLQPNRPLKSDRP